MILFIFDLFFPSRAYGSDPSEYRRSREFQSRIKNKPQQPLNPTTTNNLRFEYRRPEIYIQSIYRNPYEDIIYGYNRFPR